MPESFDVSFSKFLENFVRIIGPKGDFARSWFGCFRDEALLFPTWEVLHEWLLRRGVCPEGLEAGRQLHEEWVSLSFSNDWVDP